MPLNNTQIRYYSSNVLRLPADNDALVMEGKGSGF